MSIPHAPPPSRDGTVARPPSLRRLRSLHKAGRPIDAQTRRCCRSPSASAPMTSARSPSSPTHDLDALQPRPAARTGRPPRASRSSSGSPGLAQLAADDDRLRVERVAEVGDHPADRARPASLTTRRGAEIALGDQVDAGPAVVTSWPRRGRSSARARPRRRSSPGSPRLPHRQTAPSGRTCTCPISPASPAAPRWTRPSRTSPAPTPRADHHVDDVLQARARRRTTPRRARPGSRRCRPRRAGSAAAPAPPGLEPRPAGQDHLGAGPARAAVDRAREPDARADDLGARPRPLPRRSSRTISTASVDRVDRGVVDVDLGAQLAEHRRGEVGESDPDLVVVEGRCRRRRRRWGRAAAGRAAGRGTVWRSPTTACSTTSPRSWSSATTLPTVVRERPVSRARSLRLAVPAPPQRVDDEHAVSLAQGAH